MKNLITLVKEAFCRPFLKQMILFSLLSACGTFLPCQTALALPPSASVVILTPPQDQTVCAGSPATFTIGATGAAALTYLWQLSTDNGATWGPISNGAVYNGVATMTLQITGTTVVFNGYKYHCIVSDGIPVTSVAAKLTVNAGAGPVPPLNGNFGLTQCAQGQGGAQNNALTAGIDYQWQVSTNGSVWTDLDPADPVYGGTPITSVLLWDVDIASGLGVPMDGNLYRYKMTNHATGCSAISGIDSLHVAPMPALLQPSPASTSICSGGSTNLTFSSPPSGYAFQWRVSADNGANYSDLSNDANYSGTTTPTLGLTGITTPLKYLAKTSLTTYNYTCFVYSLSTTLTMKTLPAITGQPADSFVCATTSPKFAVTATGSNLTYQWQVSTDNGSTWGTPGSATGAATTRITLNSVTTLMDGYKYRVIVGGPCGSPQTSAIATLHVGGSGTWLGKQDTAWQHAGNWCSMVPDATISVLVPSWAPKMPLISAGTGTAYSKDITIQSGSTLTISGGITQMTGPFTIPGTVAYTGTADQQVLPSDNFGSLTISGSGNKILNSSPIISNNLGLGGSAMLVTGSNILTMKAGSNPISGASFSGAQTSWIVTGNGSSGAANTGTGGLRIAVVPNSGSPVLFPVGPTSASYNPLQLVNGGANNGFTVAVNDQYIPGAPLDATIDRTWLISAVNAGSSNISLGMLWRQSDEDHLFNRAAASVIRSNGANIVEESTTGAASGANPYSLSKGSFSTLSQFSAATSNMIVLPIRLLSFSAQSIDAASTGLLWDIDRQFDARSFIVQRSADAVHFSDIGTVNAETGRTSYRFIDSHPGIDNFYRLELVTVDSDISYSRTIQLAGQGMADRANLAPSVTEHSSVNLLLSLSRESGIVCVLTDITGHTLQRNGFRLGAGNHSLPLDISRLPGGVYFVRVTGDQGFNKVLTLTKK